MKSIFKSLVFLLVLLLIGENGMSGLSTDKNLLPKDYLAETKYLDYSNLNIKKAICEAISGAKTNREKAIAIHNYVRDKIIFGFSSSFYDMSASEVLAAQKGFCNNQSTLFAAMLRGAGVPARHRFYSLSSQILDGIINPGTDYVDHAIIEVFIEDKWIPVDSYIVDSKQFYAVQPQLTTMGLGMRTNASLEWDGISPSYSQFDKSYVEKEFGVFNDVGEFYSQIDHTNNKLGFLQKIIFPFVIGSANKKVEERRSKSV